MLPYNRRLKTKARSLRTNPTVDAWVFAEKCWRTRIGLGRRKGHRNPIV